MRTTTEYTLSTYGSDALGAYMHAPSASLPYVLNVYSVVVRIMSPIYVLALGQVMSPYMYVEQGTRVYGGTVQTGGKWKKHRRKAGAYLRDTQTL